ncbi:MAG: polymer-forming cytoskeletal protein [Bacteroidales bacterium]
MKGKEIKGQDSMSPRVNDIGKGTKIVGDITSSGDFRIDGQVEGNLVIEGRLVVGQEGFVKGQVRCKSSEIYGTLEGKFFVTELLSIKSTGKIIGEVSTAKLAIEQGAMLDGKCSMGEKKGFSSPAPKSTTASATSTSSSSSSSSSSSTSSSSIYSVNKDKDSDKS